MGLFAHDDYVTTMVVKTDVCAFSGLRIYPGHGARFFRCDGKTFQFLNSKNKRCFHMRRNPRKLNWTQIYRRMHKKMAVEEISKKRTKRTQKVTKAIAGASLEVLKAKRNQKPEVRALAREAALREIKERNKAKQASKKASAAKATPKASGKPAAAGKKGKAAVKGVKR